MEASLLQENPNSQHPAFQNIRSRCQTSTSQAINYYCVVRVDVDISTPPKMEGFDHQEDLPVPGC